MALANKPIYKSRKRWERLKDQFQKKKNQTLFSVTNWLTVLIDPTGWYSYRVTADKSRVRQQLLKKALNLKERQLKTAEKIEPDLSGTTDPFSGNPYKSLDAENVLKLYSVGKNGQDDDGQNSDEGKDDISLQIFNRSGN
jgi:hypothetical protein